MQQTWPKDWRPLADPDFHLEWGRMEVSLTGSGPVADTLELELAREVCSEHPLAEMPVTAIGFLRHCPNDFLFSLDDSSGRFAWVHLTWKKERHPPWPQTEIYEGWQDFLLYAPTAG